MKQPIVANYQTLLRRRQKVEADLAALPKGYLSQKTIKNQSYCYLQSRVGGKLTSRYLKSDEVATVTRQIALRKEAEAKLPGIITRLGELEQAASLIDKGVYRELLRLKISAGMDELAPAQKECCASFADAMNAVEGVSVSPETAREIAQWQAGNKSFLSVFESTLRRYGFPTEV